VLPSHLPPQQPARSGTCCQWPHSHAPCVLGRRRFAHHNHFLEAMQLETSSTITCRPAMAAAIGRGAWTHGLVQTSCSRVNRSNGLRAWSAHPDPQLLGSRNDQNRHTHRLTVSPLPEVLSMPLISPLILALIWAGVQKFASA